MQGSSNSRSDIAAGCAHVQTRRCCRSSDERRSSMWEKSGRQETLYADSDLPAAFFGFIMKNIGRRGIKQLRISSCSGAAMVTGAVNDESVPTTSSSRTQRALAAGPTSPCTFSRHVPTG